MPSKTRSVAAQEFTSNGLSLFEEVAATGETLVVIQEGKPIARVIPFERPRPLLGSIVWEGDIVSPVDEEWDAES